MTSLHVIYMRRSIPGVRCFVRRANKDGDDSHCGDFDGGGEHDKKRLMGNGSPIMESSD